MTTPDAAARDAQVIALKIEIEALRRQVSGLRVSPKTDQERWEKELGDAGKTKQDIAAEVYRLRLWTSQMNALNEEKEKLQADVARLSAQT